MQCEGIRNSFPTIVRPGQALPSKKDYVIVKGADAQGRTPEKIELEDGQTGQCVNQGENNIVARGFSFPQGSGELGESVSAKLYFSNGEFINVKISILTVC
mmetsp:Transcript_6660/g.11735  ORF Transcript_6660/g.11735 Transcript_6660/m.11735 type:complete len:101 (+) Transcript_6660:364-666(+)